MGNRIPFVENREYIDIWSQSLLELVQRHGGGKCGAETLRRKSTAHSHIDGGQVYMRNDPGFFEAVGDDGTQFVGRGNQQEGQFGKIFQLGSPAGLFFNGCSSLAVILLQQTVRNQQIQLVGQQEGTGQARKAEK